MRTLGHEYEFVLDLVDVKTLAKLEVTKLRTVELAIDEEVGWTNKQGR